MGDIFICHTLYHVLIALVRALRSRPGKSTLVLSTCVPEAETLRAKLLDAVPDLWDAVLIVDEEKLDAQNSESDFYRLRHPFRKPYFTLPKGHVYISNDWSALGRYLQRERRVYTLCEDTFGGTLDPDQHLLDEQRTNPRGPYRYWGDSPCCRTVESEDAARCSIFGVDKLVTVSKAQLLESLMEEEKAIIRRVFLAVPLPEHVQGACLLLPRSFVLDGLMDQPTQDAMFAAVAKKYCTEPLFIKTHPAGYHGLFRLFLLYYPAPRHTKRGSQFLPAPSNSSAPSPYKAGSCAALPPRKKRCLWGWKRQKSWCRGNASPLRGGGRAQARSEGWLPYCHLNDKPEGDVPFYAPAA